MKFYCLCQITGDVPDRAHDSQGFGPPDNQMYGAPNRFGVTKDADGDDKEYATDMHGQPVRPVLLARPMEQIQTGVPQEVPLHGGKPPANQWFHTDKENGQRYITQEQQLLKEARQHHPAVDILKCPVCGAMIARE